MLQSETTFILPDGRQIGFAESGDPAGTPLFYFPGTPGSRLLFPPSEISLAHHVRVITLERPGFGLSTFQPQRSLLGWADDVAEIATQLKWPRFRIVGASGGGPFALACAYLLSDRLDGVAVISGVGPTDLPGGLKGMPRIRQAAALLARLSPRLLEFALQQIGDPHKDIEAFYARMLSGNSAEDQDYLSQPDVKALIQRHYLEATRQGTRGLAWEGVIVSRPWGFRLQDIHTPVWLWHGDADKNVSLAAARLVAQSIPGCKSTFVPGSGHFLLWQRWGEIIDAMLPPLH